MDILSMGKAMKAKKAMKELKDRLGEGVQDIHPNVKTRLEELEKKDPGAILNKRVSALEANTAVNLNKHNLKVKAITQHDKFKMNELVYDDLADASGIDATKSRGHAHDPQGKKFQVAAGQANAEVVTVAEPVTANQFAISFVGNGANYDKVSVPLNGGVFNNTELVDGKIQLKVVGNINNGTQLATPKMASNTAPSGKVSASSYLNTNYQPFMAFNQVSSPLADNTWMSASGQLKGWLEYEFSTPKIIKQYNIMLPFQNPSIAPKSWTFEASNDGVTWTILDNQVNVTNWDGSVNPNFISFPLTNQGAFLKYRINISQNNGSTYYVAIGELELIEDKASSIYSPSGSYESPVMDLGDNFKELYKVEEAFTVPEGTGKKVLVASSRDGLTFSEYLPLNSDGTIATPSGRYVKIRVELTAGSSTKETLVHDFTAEERSAFQENEHVVFDAAAKLKINYEYSMELDTKFVQVGTLFKKTINKSLFKSVEEIEVKN